MKKNLFLTLLLALLSTATMWAKFAPEEGKMYALKETTTGLYLDIRTLGVTEPNGRYTTCMSFSESPCVIYFAQGTTDATKWTMKNEDGTYAMQAAHNWNAVIGTTAYEWIIAEPEKDIFTLASTAGYINVDTPTAGQCMYCNSGTALKFELMEFSTSYELGDIKSSDDLMAATTATNIAIKNLTSTNGYYLAGTTSKENFEDAILVWEPVTDGTEGTYYLRTTDTTNGYIQQAAANTTVSLGTKDAAQVFYTVEPTSTGATNAEKFTDTSGLVSTADQENLVRFVQDGGENWLNCQGSSASPKFVTGTAYGTWTVHNVYAVNVTETLTKVVSTDTSIGIAGTYTLKTTDGTYLGADCTFSSSAVNLNLTPHENGCWVIEDAANAGTYIGVGDASAAVTTDTEYKWAIGAADIEGYAPIMRADDNTKFLGNTATTAGTTVLTDVTADYNTWYFTGTYNVATAGTVSSSKYTFTSNKIYYAGVSNKLRFTLTQSAAYYKSGAKRLSLDSFVLYDADGNTIDITTNDITGNNITDFSGMLSGNDNSSSNATWDDSASPVSDDYFEITLDEDFGGAFSFSFVTENTTMNAQAFEIVTSWQEPADYTFAIEGAPADATVTATYDGVAITAGSAIPYNYDKALLVYNDIEGYSPELVVDKNARTITLVYTKKYSIVLSDAPDGVAITYNSNSVTTGNYLGATYDTQNLAVTCPNGYTWVVTRDDENKVITITFTQLQSEVNPASVVALLKRIGGDGTADKFKIVLDPSLNYDNETFVIGGEDGKVLIKGTTLSAITTGIGWYLQNIAHINIAWNSLNEKTVSGDAYADLSNITVPTAEETHTSAAKYRYYLNTCAFGYSMTTWTWKRWQQEIDWMALHGINMPLQLVGLEEVWRKFLTTEENGVRKYGYTDEEAKAFVAGPAFIAWWAMNNLQGWGGTAAGTKSGGTWEGAGGVQDDAWYTRQKDLAQDIVARQRELGMQPVIPGWSGMVPSNFESQSGYTTRGNGGNWAGDFVRPLLLNVSNANYGEIAADYYKCLHEVMGESQYYSMDPFHEGGGAGTMEDYTAMYEAMEQAKPGSQWVIQQWQWTSTQRYSLTAVPAGRLVVLDLFADGKPAFDSYSGYSPQDAVFCAIPNFGGRSGLMARLTNLTDNYFSYKAKYATIKGIGAAPEAIEQTPVTYDLIFQLPWMGSKPDVAEWVSNYAISRYGQDNEEIKEAWSLLRQSVFNYGADGIEGPIEDVWAARPNLVAWYVSSWGSTLSQSQKGVNVSATYTKARRQMLIDATYKLLSQKDVISGDIYLSNYYYDLVELGGGVLADYAHDLLLGIGTAKDSEGTTGETYIKRRDAFLQLILDVDAFKGTNLNFRLGKWTQEARDAAGEVTDATTATPDWYEYNNARTLVSTWSSPGTNLNDYSYRSWQGLMKDLYYPRWQYYFTQIESGVTPTGDNYKFFEWNWAHGKEHSVGQTAVSSTALTTGQQGHTDTYTRDPEGSTVEKATEVLGKYIIPIKADEGSHYAYRYLTETNNDFTAAVISVTEGATIDLNDYFGDLTSGGTVTVTVAGDAINDATTYTAVTIKDDAAGDADYTTSTATITLSDGTAFTVTIKATTSDYAEAKASLASLIEKMETLTAQVGTYATETEIAMQTTSGQPYYIWCNNVQTNEGGGVAALLDNDNYTYLHSNWSAPSSSNDYLQLELGTGNALKKFKISGVQRSGANNDFPETIQILGSNDGQDWSDITTVNDLPQSSGASWTSDVIVPAADYTYLKFIVTTGTNRIYFHLAEFNIYEVETTADVLDKYDGTELTDAFAAEKYDVLLNAKLVYENGTTDEIKAATVTLQDAYDELEPLANVEESPEHAELTALIGYFKTLMNTVANVIPTNVIPLQTSNENEEGYIYSNATIAEGTLSNLWDGDNETIAHTTWSGDTPDSENHYLRVYLGENPTLSDFTFSYVTRNNDAATEKPEQITVAGSATVDGEYTTIATLTDLPSASQETYTSATYNATGYKYLRFMVDDTYRDDLTDGNGHKAYSIAEFAVYDLNTLRTTATLKDADYTTLRGITNSEIATAYAELQAAIATNATGTAAAKETTYQSLKATYDALNAKLQYMDEGVYTISFGGNPVFIGYRASGAGDTNYSNDKDGYHLYDADNEDGATADGADALFTITHSGLGYQLQAQGQYLEATKSNGWAPIFFNADVANAGVYMFEETATTGVYKLKSNQTDIQYINDWGNVFGNDKANVASSTFTLVQVTEYSVTIPASGSFAVCLPFNVVLPEGVTAYDVVAVGDNANGEKVYEITQLASAGGKIAAGTPVILKGTADTTYNLTITLDATDAVGAADGSLLRGNFVKATIAAGKYIFANAVFSRIDAETGIAANSVWMEYAVEIDGNIIEGTINNVVPTTEVVDGGIYRIKGQLSDGTLRTLYTNGSKKTILWTTDDTKTDATTLFIAQKNEENGKFKFVSALANGIWGHEDDLTEEGVELTLSEGTVAGTYMIVGNDNRLYCVDAEDLDHFSNVGTAGATVNTTVTTDFVFEEVTDATVSYTLSMKSTNNWATLYLPYAVKVPGDLVAYYAYNPGNGYVQLRDLNGIIPAYTPVVIGRSVAANALEVTTTGYEFTYTTEACSVDYSSLDKVLYGKLIDTYLEEAGNNVYVILTIGDNEAFYWIYKEYDEKGKYIGTTGTYFKCSANKAYMTQAAGSNNAASYSFHIEGTTGIEDVVEEGSEVQAIYDLQGRKITEPSSPGVYIINGKTVIVK